MTDRWRQSIRKSLIKFSRQDPRWQISLHSRIMCEDVSETQLALYNRMPMMIHVICQWTKSSSFSVWRPTSSDAIELQMTGNAVGKGMNVKGKSAKKGLLSGYVPFLQIHSNDAHKTMIGTLPKDARITVFFGALPVREAAVRELTTVMEEMTAAAREARGHVDNIGDTEDVIESALKTLHKWEMIEPSIDLIDTYAPVYYGIDIPERLFWESFVMRRSINREVGGPMETGRPSAVDFQDMNFISTRKAKPPQSKVCVVQHGGYAGEDDDDEEEDPLCPLTLVVAYEEHGRVMPVAADFDPFLVGTKGVTYETPLGEQERRLLKWCVHRCQEVLDDPQSDQQLWTDNWLDVLKREYKKGFHHNPPLLGYGDAKSLKMIQNIIECSKDMGSVRHGAECFNYTFPQELDNEFLVIFPSEKGQDKSTGTGWTYMNQDELRGYLCQMAQEGYVFPLNPKWVACDRGWKDVYDALHASQNPEVHRALDVWYPRDLGVREIFEDLHRRFPGGFKSRRPSVIRVMDGTLQMDRADLALKRYLLLERAKLKLRCVLKMRHLNDTSDKKEDDKPQSVLGSSN